MDSDPMPDTKKMLQDKNLVKSLRYDSQFYKTKLCIFFQSGRCSRKFCKFAHGMEELQCAPDLRKTAMCKAFLTTQRCDQEDCSFAHSLDELRATDKFYKTTMCCFYYYGSCKLGDLCRHAHSKEELRSLPDLPGLPESLACALLIEQSAGRNGDSRVPRTPGPQESEEQLQEIEVLRRTVLEVKQQMGKLHNNEPRMAELQRREHQSLNRLQQLTELQTLQRFALQTQSMPSMPPPGPEMAPYMGPPRHGAPGHPGEMAPPLGPRPGAHHLNPGMAPGMANLPPGAPIQNGRFEGRFLEQQELQEQMNHLKRQEELQEQMNQQLQQQLQQQQLHQLQHHQFQQLQPLQPLQPLQQQPPQQPPQRMNPMMQPTTDMGFSSMPSFFGTGSIDTSLMKMPMQEAFPAPKPPTSPGHFGFGADTSPRHRPREGFPLGQVGNNVELPFSQKVSPPSQSFAPIGQVPLGGMGGLPERPGLQFETFQRPPPPQQQPPPQPQMQPQMQPLQPPQMNPPQMQPPSPPQPNPNQIPPQEMTNSQKELELLQQQIRYHQHMQKQMQQKMDERVQKLRDMGFNAGNLPEEDEDDDDEDSLGPIPGWSREGSLREPHRKQHGTVTSPKMLRLEETGRMDPGADLDEEDLGEDPKWVRTRTMPAAVNLKAQAQQAAMAGVDRPTPSVASTADSEKTGGRSEEKEDPAEDLGPDPTWHRVHSTPAGSANYAAPQPVFQKGFGVSGAADDAFGPNRRATTMDQVRGRAMAPSMQQGVVPVMMLVPQTMITPQQMAPGAPYLMAKQSMPVLPGNVVQASAVQPGVNVQPPEDLRQMQAQVLQAAMPEIYED